MSLSEQQSKADELCCILASLNYNGQQTIVTADQFEKPNFALVCDLLNWFRQIILFESQVNKSSNDVSPVPSGSQLLVASDKEQLNYLNEMRLLFSKKLGLRLNMVSIYKSDLDSCGELLKIARLIKEAAILAKNRPELNTEPIDERRNKHQEKVRQMMDLVNHEEGINLVNKISNLIIDVDELLLKEDSTLSKERQIAIDQGELQGLPQIEKTLNESKSDVLDEANEIRQANTRLRDDLVRLNERLQSKRGEIRKAKDRLDDLLMTQPPEYSSKYEALQKDYEKAYDGFVARYRSFAYLRSCLYPSDTDANSSSYAYGLNEGSCDTKWEDELLEYLLSELPTPNASDNEAGEQGSLLNSNGSDNKQVNEIRQVRTDFKPEASDPTKRLASDIRRLSDGLEFEGLLNEFIATEGGKDSNLSSLINQEEANNDAFADLSDGDVKSSIDNDDDRDNRDEASSEDGVARGF